MDITQVIGAASGVAMGLAGLWLLRGAKRLIQPAEDGDSANSQYGERSGLSSPTQTTIGMALLLVGYHVVSWSLPTPLFGVPVERWWMVVGIAALAVVGAFIADRVERLKGI